MKIKNIFLLCLLGSAMPVDAAANKVEIKREGGNIVMLPMNDNANQNTSGRLGWCAAR